MKITKIYSAGIFAAAALFIAGCFNPDLTGVVFKCDDISNAQCPAGQTCLEGDCVVAGPDTPFSMAPGSDGGTGGVDMALPGGSTTGCSAGSGTDVSKGSSKQAYTCAGTFGGFNKPSASSLCASGFQICTSADTIDLTKCNQDARGFFVTNILSKRDKNSLTNIGCGAPGGGQIGMLAGCGGGSSSIVSLPSACGGFSKAWDSSDSKLDCYKDFAGDYSADWSVSTRSEYGVLCCKK